MKLSLIFAALSLTSGVLGAPTIEERQVTPADAVKNSVDIAQGAVVSNGQAIGITIINAKNSVVATAQVIAAINADTQAIVNNITALTNTITATLTAAGGGVIGQGQALTQNEIDTLTAGLNTLQQVLFGIGVIFFFEVSNLTPAVQAAIQGENTLLLNTIGPFLTPIAAFASAASNASAKAGATVTGLNAAYNGFVAAAANLARANGLPALPGADLPALPGSVTTQ